MPNSTTRWIFCKCLDRPRSANEPPFFFQEVRIGMLMVSILFNLGRLIYEATMKDISVILVAARLFLTTLQLFDHLWFCKNWESFFVQKKMRAYMWFRFFAAVCMFSMIYCVLKTFPPYTNSSRLKIDAFQWSAGLQVIVWYYWGKRWNFQWGDMSDERRIPAIVGFMFTTSLIYGLQCMYLLGTTTKSFQSAMTSGITATVAYFLMGVAFRYLDIVTNRSTKACRRILEESRIASGTDGHSIGTFAVVERKNAHPPSLHTPLPSTRRHSNLMINIRQSIESRKQSISRNESSRREPTTTADDAARTFGNHVEVEMITEENNRMDEDEENGFIGRRFIREYVDPTFSLDGSSSCINNSSNTSTILNRPNECDDIGCASTSLNNGAYGIDINRVRVKPNYSHTNANSNSIEYSAGPPLSEITDHLMIDHVNVPITRQNSLETNLANYETAHLLSDKIVVVFVQVITPT